MRCQGDGYIALDYRIDPVDVTKLTPLDAESASCQLPGAIESGNIQFGHLLAGAHGSQWAIQFLRIIAGEVSASLPAPQTANISFGTLGRFELNSQNIDPRSEIQPTLHDEETIESLVRSGDFDSLPIRETLAHYANAATDIEFLFPFGYKELEGIHSRTDFDLKAHENRFKVLS